MTGSEDTPDLALTRFRAVSEESLRRAGESLSGLLGHPVRLTDSAISTVPVGALPDLTAEAVSGPMAGLLIRFSGEAAGQIVILFPLATVFRMLGVLLKGQVRLLSLSETERSAVQEVGNILAGPIALSHGVVLVTLYADRTRTVSFDLAGGTAETHSPGIDNYPLRFQDSTSLFHSI